ncbi:hypothetical protein [Pseudoduganella buxea]|uniref:NAD-dependent epimerase/dehydratase family protein n=1 Tax=Pseudoduganella buxea TaxID=1949069 RepID=A0A6I3STD9_9BURK|nr:hypothetical protein [Pseudoduganella buxea]MTV52453.1 hypothetical protein [Pseudoduganella buxea]GGC18296.1 hypothetical protein GCM10011572_44580 [Pseudoduganella buxea]
MLVLLTGATGFPGTHLATLLAAKAHRTGADPRIGLIPADVAHDSEKSFRLARLRGGDAVIDTVSDIAARSGA